MPIRCYFPMTGPGPTEMPPPPPLKKSWSLFIKYQFRSFIRGDSPRDSGTLSLYRTIYGFLPPAEGGIPPATWIAFMGLSHDCSGVLAANVLFMRRCTMILLFSYYLFQSRLLTTKGSIIAQEDCGTTSLESLGCFSTFDLSRRLSSLGFTCCYCY